MLDFVTLEDDKADFWEQNPELKYIEPFATFSKKKDSSNIMKAISFMILNLSLIVAEYPKIKQKTT